MSRAVKGKDYLVPLYVSSSKTVCLCVNDRETHVIVRLGRPEIVTVDEFK